MLHSRIFSPLDGERVCLTVCILNRQWYRLTWATLGEKDGMIGVSARIVNPQGCNAVANVLLEVVVRENFPKSGVFDLSSDEEDGRRSLARWVLQVPGQLIHSTGVEEPEVVDADNLQPRQVLAGSHTQHAVKRTRQISIDRRVGSHPRFNIMRSHPLLDATWAHPLLAPERKLCHSRFINGVDPPWDVRGEIFSSPKAVNMEVGPSNELQILREKKQAFCGAFKIPLNKLKLEQTPENPRQIDAKNVTNILERFHLEKCNRLEPERYVSALISRAESPHNLRPHTDPFEEPQHFNPPQALLCLDGEHRLEAANRFLAGEDRWWVANLYFDGTICQPSPLESRLIVQISA